MKYVIVGNGEIKDYIQFADYCKDARVVACDGGMRHCKKADVIPDVIMGDMDSVEKDTAAYYFEKKIENYKFPSHKDYTDMELGLEYAVENGANSVYIFGGTGTRLDHTIANVHILKRALDKGIEAWLINEHNRITLVDREFKARAKKGSLVSVIPLTTEAVVSNDGLEYKLTDYKMKIGNALGVSNVVIEEEFSVNIKDGIVILILARD